MIYDFNNWANTRGDRLRELENLHEDEIPPDHVLQTIGNYPNTNLNTNYCVPQGTECPTIKDIIMNNDIRFNPQPECQDKDPTSIENIVNPVEKKAYLTSYINRMKSEMEQVDQDTMDLKHNGSEERFGASWLGIIRKMENVYNILIQMVNVMAFLYYGQVKISMKN